MLNKIIEFVFKSHLNLIVNIIDGVDRKFEL